MPLIANLTLAQLRAATKAQIITGITNYLNNMTKRQIIHFLMDTDVINDEPTFLRRPDGQIESQIEKTRDMETGVSISIKTTVWSYYETGEVDEIAITETDSNGAEIGRYLIKHYTDGRQPERITKAQLQERVAGMGIIDTPEEKAQLTLWQKILSFFGATP